MAKCYAGCRGEDKTRVKEDHRLGSVAAKAWAQTFKTFAECYVKADGSGYVTVRRGDKVIREFIFGPEDEGVKDERRND